METSKTTLLIGASEKADRYAYKAIKQLVNAGIKVYALAKRSGNVAGVEFDIEPKNYTGIHTVTLYVSAPNQVQYYDYIVSLNPKRVLFNPGTENKEFELFLTENKIEVVKACTLVMLSIRVY